jgi:hypothetical protein
LQQPIVETAQKAKIKYDFLMFIFTSALSMVPWRAKIYENLLKGGSLRVFAASMSDHSARIPQWRFAFPSLLASANQLLNAVEIALFWHLLN